jgi:hypothetical protein
LVALQALISAAHPVWLESSVPHTGIVPEASQGNVRDAEVR